MSEEQSTQSSPTITRFSPTKSINISTGTPENQARSQAQDLRQIAEDRLTELTNEESEWAVQEGKYHQQCEELNSQLRDLDDQFQKMKTEEQTKHIKELQELQGQHKENMLFIQNQINEKLEAEVDDGVDETIEEYDRQIASLKEEIANWDQQPSPSGNDELFEDDIEDRITRLEQQFEEMSQIHDEAVQMRDDESQESMSKLQQIIQTGQENEQKLNQEVQDLLDQLNSLDSEHEEKMEEMRKEMEEEKNQTKNTNRTVFSKIRQIQLRITQKQREHAKQIQELQNQSDALRTELESLTARQRQQMKEASTAAKTFSELKKKFVSMHKELEMLNSEKVREIIEHETLMKGLNKMDNFVLSQMAASASASFSSSSFNSSSRPSRSSMFSSSHGSKI